MDHVEKLISDVKLSSVVPGRITGDDKMHHELTNMDLIMKLHYIKGLYFFKNDAVEGLHIHDLKLPMFKLLEIYYHTSGRIRQSGDGGGGGGGRPFIKCNDGGVRIVEAKCKNKTIDEWLMAMNDHDEEELVYDQPLGPELGFSPLVFIQFTWFKCGGMSLGLSWAHVLGDSFSASNFLNMWAQIMVGQLSPQFLQKSTRSNKLIINPMLSTVGKLPFSLKRVDPVGDHWKITNTIKMQSHSFHITQKQLNQLISKVSGTKVKPFDVICATMWKMLAKVRGKYSSEPKIVTIIRRDDNFCNNKTTEVPCNNQVIISIVEANDVKVFEADTSKLAELIAKKTMDETGVIEELMEKENGISDFVVYGANLTFVDLEETKIYDLELRGKKPIFASYNISGVGDEGVIMVLPRLEGGRIVNLVLPQKQIEGLKNKMREELGIF